MNTEPKGRGMNTVIFRNISPIIVAIMVIFSIYVCLRGHNEPGGGFIGGLIAASAIAVFGMSSGVPAVRRALRYDPLSYAGAGVFIAALAGLMSIMVEAPFLTSIWMYFDIGDSYVPFSSPLIFDIGVYLAVFGAIAAIALSLEDRDQSSTHGAGDE